MTRIDFTPLYRTAIGFDRMTRLLESAFEADQAAGYPPYNIEQYGEDKYRITMAVAGFDEDDLSVEVKEGVLTVSGKRDAHDEGATYLHHGIPAVSFTRTFQLAEYVDVVSANLSNGLLSIDLVRELPEEKKPRRIEIATSAPAKLAAKAKKLIGGKAKAA
jgi:molecular chaperone IbpA